MCTAPVRTHKSSVVAKFIKQALNGETLEIYGDGKQTRDFIYIDDLARAILQAASKEGIGGEAFQIATNTETTVSDILELLKKVLEEKGIGDIRTINGESRIGDVRRNFSDTTKAKRYLSWQPAVSLWQGVEYTVEWFLGR